MEKLFESKSRVENRITLMVSEVRTPAGDPNPCGFSIKWQINPYMKVGASSLVRAEAEHDLFVRTLTYAGAEVLRLPYLRGSYDSVFMKDDAIVCTHGDKSKALLARPFTSERRREPELRVAALASHGIEVVAQSAEFLEGGDVLVCAEEKLAFMGYGFRTTIAAAQTLQNFLGFEVLPLELRDPYFYHLDTAMNITHIDGQPVLFACPEAFTSTSWQHLCSRPEINRIVRVSRDEAKQFALNWVEVSGTIILGAHVPQTERALKGFGKTPVVCPLGQFQLAGGSAACLVATVHKVETAATQRYAESAKGPIHAAATH